MKLYRDKTNRSGAWRGMLSAVAVVLLSLLAFVSCTDEQMLGRGDSSLESDGDRLKVRISVPQSGATRSTELGSADESRLDSVTILVFKKDANLEAALLEVALTVDLRSENTSLSTSQPLWGGNGNGTDSTLIVELKKPLGAKIIYAIANWDTTGFEVDAYSVADLNKEITTTANAGSLQAAFPMLMSSGAIVVDDLSDVSYKVSANLMRQQAKFRAKLQMEGWTQVLNNSIVWQLDELKIWVNNVPTQAFVVEKNATPSPTPYLNSDRFEVKLTRGWAGIDIEWDTHADGKDIYINQNMSNDSATASYIVVQLPYINRFTNYREVDNYYKLYFNTSTTDKTIKRNTLYAFKILILGLGLPINGLVENVNVANNLKILPWENVNLEDVEDMPQKSFKIDRTKFEFQVIAEAIYANISTNVPEWKLINESDGKVVLSSDSINKKEEIDGVEYSWSGTPSLAKIKMEKTKVGALTKINQFYITGQNLKIPIKVAYDNGIILAEELNGAGWSGFQGIGVQIAKVGNVLPTMDALQSDWVNVYWGSADIKLAATEASIRQSFGYGKSNTDLILSVGQNTKETIAWLCRNLGPEWYLPSFSELNYAARKKTGLGSSYTFTYMKDDQTGSLRQYISSSPVAAIEGDYVWGIGYASGILREQQLARDPKPTNQFRCFKNLP